MRNLKEGLFLSPDPDSKTGSSGTSLVEGESGQVYVNVKVDDPVLGSADHVVGPQEEVPEPPDEG